MTSVDARLNTERKSLYKLRVVCSGGHGRSVKGGGAAPACILLCKGDGARGAQWLMAAKVPQCIRSINRQDKAVEVKEKRGERGASGLLVRWGKGGFVVSLVPAAPLSRVGATPSDSEGAQGPQPRPFLPREGQFSSFVSPPVRDRETEERAWDLFTRQEPRLQP